MRRSRTVSFLRPLSELSVGAESAKPESGASRRSLSISSQRASRPPSLSYSRTNSDASILSRPISENQKAAVAHEEPHASLVTQWMALDSTSDDFSKPTASQQIHEISTTTSGVRLKPEETNRPEHIEPSTTTVPTRVESQTHSLSMSPRHRVLSEDYSSSQSISRWSTPSQNTSSCTCGFRDLPLASAANPNYSDASVQTDFGPLSPRPSLRNDTYVSSDLVLNQGHDVESREIEIPIAGESSSANPVFMGRMMDYFNKPGYQLGDSLMSAYHCSYEPSMYSYQDDFGDEG